jgi:hypothetical protein
MAIQVTLSPSEIMMGSSIGTMRHIESQKSNLGNAHGLTNAQSILALDVEGACGELAYCKARNVFFEGTVNTFKKSDVGSNVQIRTTPSHENSLIVRDGDSDNEYFVLVTGVCPTYFVRGYILGKNAKQEKWKRDYNNRTPAYFVPQDALMQFKEKKSD